MQLHFTYFQGQSLKLVDMELANDIMYIFPDVEVPIKSVLTDCVTFVTRVYLKRRKNHIQWNLGM